MSGRLKSFIPVSVTVTFVVAPVSPETLMVEGYGTAGLGGAMLLLMAMLDGLEKTVDDAAFNEREARAKINRSDSAPTDRLVRLCVPRIRLSDSELRV
jgi:hypothetical protein